MMTAMRNLIRILGLFLKLGSFMPRMVMSGMGFLLTWVTLCTAVAGGGSSVLASSLGLGITISTASSVLVCRRSLSCGICRGVSSRVDAVDDSGGGGGGISMCCCCCGGCCCLASMTVSFLFFSSFFIVTLFNSSFKKRKNEEKKGKERKGKGKK